jgi:hypothetical protein
VRKKIPTGRGKDRPKDTRCYVPGYLDDATQHAVDQQQLGLVPLAIAGAVASKLPLASMFKTPSDKRAKKVIGPVIASANSGNLTAVAVMDNRRRIGGAGIASERAVWQNGFNQVTGAVRAVYDPIASKILGSIPSGYKGPEEAAAYALAHPQGPPTAGTGTGPTQGVPGPQQPGVLPQPAQPSTPGYQPPTSGGPNITITMPGASGGGTVPQSTEALPGGETPATDALAKPPAKASLADMFGGGSMGPMILAGAGLFIISQVMGTKRRR